jgi:uncharacterized damage-inducible protein DinB
MSVKVVKDLSYPIGKFEKTFDVTSKLRREFINEIAKLPEKLQNSIANLNDEQLDTPYRPGGWTVRQTVHHVADSHLNSLTRFKLALTEEVPTIRPYYEDRWAELADSFLPIEHSMQIIEGLHFRWTTLLKSMTEEHFKRKLIHPESGEWTLEEFLGLYAWHSRHHTAHITNLRSRNNW